VWYDFGDGSYPQSDYTPFHTYQPSSSGGAGGGVLALAAAGPALLYATFTGALAKLGTVILTWNGVSWVGESPAGGGCVLSLLGQGGAFQLMAAGPGAAFIVAGQPTVPPQFHWAAQGKALGALSGPFGVTITE
jgi:hypothetical protein